MVDIQVLESEKTLEMLAYVVGNSSVILSRFSPLVSTVATGAKMGARFGKSIKSYGRGGFCNPAFYANSASTVLSATAFTLNAAASICPLALPLYGLSVSCSTAADAIDENLSFINIIL